MLTHKKTVSPDWVKARILDSLTVERATRATITDSLAEDIAKQGVLLSSYATLDLAITAISTDDKTLIVDKDETISEETTIPANITLEFVNGSVLTILDTLIINGSIKYTTDQLFTDTGYVNFSGMKDKRVYPEWWGVKTDGADYATEVTKCIQDSVTLIFSGGIYTMGSIESGDVWDTSPNDGVTNFAMEGNNTIYKSTRWAFILYTYCFLYCFTRYNKGL